MTLIKEPTPENILLAAKNLKDGALIGLPTETVYGLAADAENRDAVRRIYEVKGRPFDHPLIVHIGSIEYLEKWAIKIPQYAKLLAEKFWPGPMTLILKRSEIAKDFITGRQDSVGIRFPKNQISLSLLKEFHSIGGNGLAAPSANKFGAVSPTNSKAVEEEIGNCLIKSFDLIIDGGQSEIGLESTIISCLGKFPEILRPGLIDENDIKDNVEIKLNLKKTNKNLRYSGQMKRHYSPRAQVITEGLPKAGDGFIALSNIGTPPNCIRLISPIDLNSFASQLYEALREADRLLLNRVFIILPLEKSAISEAIYDRVSKARKS